MYVDRKERFDKAVEAFLQKNGLENVEEIITKNHFDNFITEPSIASYLRRPAKDIEFDESGEPVLQSDYEKQFYEACRLTKDTKIPYRATESNLQTYNEAEQTYYTRSTTAFYEAGTNEKTNQTLNKITNRKINNPIETESNEPSANVFLVANGDDIYSITGVLRTIQGQRTSQNNMQGIMKDANDKEISLPDEGISFLIFPTGKDAHAITLFAVVDNENKEVIRTGLCNSSINEPYYNYIKPRFNVDASSFGYEPFEFLNCSLDLQKDPTDLNCGLYRANFTSGLIDLLQNDAEARQILSDKNADESAIVEKITNGLKSHLPQYYNESSAGFTEVSEEQKMQVHLEDRWEADNAYLKDRMQEIKRSKSNLQIA
jgi:hypothetical protein